MLIVGSGHVPPLKQVDEQTAGKDETQNEDKMKIELTEDCAKESYVYFYFNYVFSFCEALRRF